MPIPVESSTPAPVGTLDGRLRFPATDDRLAYESHGPNLPLLSQAGKPVVIYSDAAGSILADIVNDAGAAIAGSTLTVDNNSQIPEFFGPVGVEVLYARLNGGTAYPIYAWVDYRLDGLQEQIDDILVGSGFVTQTAGDARYRSFAGPRSETVAHSSVFAVDPTGVTNSTAGLVAAIAASSKRLIIPDGTYKVDPNVLALATGLKVEMYGAILEATSSGGTLLTLADENEIHGGELRGFGSASAYNISERLVSMVGTVGDYKSHALLRDMYLNGSSGYGVYSKFAEDIELDNVDAFDICYAGIMGLSVSRMRIKGGTLNMNESIGGSGNAYGVAFSRSNGNLTDQPRSTDCEVNGTTVLNNPLWEAFDTHGGNRIKFLDVTALNCKVGVAIVPADDISNVETFAPHGCVVDGYLIDSQVSDGSRGSGIIVQGTSSEKAVSCIVGSGSIIGHGTQASVSHGGLNISHTIAFRADGAVVIDCAPYSVNMLGENKGFSLAFTSIDPWTDSLTLAAHLRLTGVNNTGHLADHVFDRNAKVAAYVGTEGVRVDNVAGNALTIGTGYETTLARSAGVDGTMTPFSDIGNKISTPVRRRLTVGTLTAATATPLLNILHGTATWDPPSLADGAATSTAFTLTGARVGDPVVASLDTLGTNEVLITAHVRQANVVRIEILNKTGGVLDLPSGTVRAAVLNYSP